MALKNHGSSFSRIDSSHFLIFESLFIILFFFFCFDNSLLRWLNPSLFCLFSAFASLFVRGVWCLMWFQLKQTTTALSVFHQRFRCVQGIENPPGRKSFRYGGEGQTTQLSRQEDIKKSYFGDDNRRRWQKTEWAKVYLDRRESFEDINQSRQTKSCFYWSQLGLVG